MKPPFAPRSAFAPPPDYRIMPLRFDRFDSDRYIVTNDVGEYVLLRRSELVDFANRRLDVSSDTYKALKTRHFLADPASTAAFDLLALKYRTRLEATSEFTGLHIFVLTLRCDHSCHYCQVSRQTEDKLAFDMSREHADKALALVFQSPSPQLKIEFQGGEPLLHFDLLRYIVERAERINERAGRDLEFVIATNLSRIDDEILAFCKAHRILLSTSLDGPPDLHNRQRPLRGKNSHEVFVENLQHARQVLGHGAIAALMTTTPASLSRVDDIIDEYIRLGFTSIFLRSVSPFGFAAKNSLIRRYSSDDWLTFYKRGLDRVLQANARGHHMREEFTAILLQKILAPTGSRYVDLQSPAGLGIGAIVYNFDGYVYASDEGRMLAEMGDTSFRLGHLDSDSFDAIMSDENLLDCLDKTMLDGVPGCSDCPYLPYCGSDPVFHRVTQNDVIGHKAFSTFCEKQTGVLRHLISLLEDDADARAVLLRWL